MPPTLEMATFSHSSQKVPLHSDMSWYWFWSPMSHDSWQCIFLLWQVRLPTSREGPCWAEGSLGSWALGRLSRCYGSQTPRGQHSADTGKWTPNGGTAAGTWKKDREIVCIKFFCYIKDREYFQTLPVLNYEADIVQPTLLLLSFVADQRWNSWASTSQKIRFFCSMLFTVASTGGF